MAGILRVTRFWRAGDEGAGRAGSRGLRGRCEPACLPARYVAGRCSAVEGRHRRMRLGMTLRVDIHTGERRVINFFLDPITKYLHNGVEER